MKFLLVSSLLYVSLVLPSSLTAAFVTPAVQRSATTTTTTPSSQQDAKVASWQHRPWGMLGGTTSSSRPTRQKQQTYLQAAHIIIAGAPASGKGTQCEVIKDKLGVVHLSTGDMLRAAVAAGTEVGQQAKDYMDSGKLVPVEVII